MGGGAEVEFVRFVEEGGEDVRREERRRTENLDSVRSLFRNVLGKLARLIRRVDRSAIPIPIAGENVRIEPRRHDLILRAAIAFVDAPVGSVSAAGLAHGRHAVRHPQFKNIFGGCSLRLTAGVAVHVDESRKNPEIRAVDLPRRVFRPTFCLDRHLWKSDAADLANAIALDDDVHRSNRRRTRPVDEHCPTDNQTLKRTFAFVGAPVRRVGDLLRGRGCGKQE